MGIRSKISSFGRRLRAALAGDEKGRHFVQYTYVPVHVTHDPHGHSCRVCAVSQNPSIDDQQLCHSHRADWLTSRPLPSLPEDGVPEPLQTLPISSEFPSYSTENAWCSRQRSQYSSLANVKKYTPYRPPTEEYDEDYQINRTLQFVRLVVAIQAALLPVRYAIGGHLALRLYDPLWDMGLPSETSRATKPSIVCPLATRDVLPSWAAASHKAFLFNPKQPDCLGVRVGERYVAVAIQWVDDCEFDRPGLLYEIDQTHTIYNFVNDNNDAYSIQLDMAPPILSLKSLLQQIAVAYIETKSGSSSTVASKSEQSSLGYQVNACLRLLILQMAPDNQFLRPYEIPAIHDPTFLGLYYTNFGTRGKQVMHAVSGGYPPLAATSIKSGLPSARPSSASSTAAAASVSSVSSSSSMHSIRRKPLPINARDIISKAYK